jgi:hypothetical protein
MRLLIIEDEAAGEVGTLLLLLHADSNATDSSPYNHTATTSGITYATGQFSDEFRVTTSGGYLSVSSTVFTPAAGEWFALDFWVNTIGPMTNATYRMVRYEFSTGHITIINDSPAVRWTYDSDGFGIGDLGVTGIPNSGRHHVVIQLGPASDALNGVWVDGTQTVSNSIRWPASASGSSTITLGEGASSNAWNLGFDEVRLRKHSAALYTGSFTPPASPYSP